MPVTVTRNYKLSTNGGQVIYMSEAEAQTLVVDETRATLICDSSRCKSRHEADSPATATWVEEECQKDPTKIPDGVSDFIAFGQGKVACCAQCLRDYMIYDYVRPPSPKELRAKMEQAKAAQAEELTALNPHLLAPESARTEYHVSEVPATLPPHCGDTLKVVQNRTITVPEAGTYPIELDTETGVGTPAVEVPALCQADGYAGEES